jgi:omega-hydroxy-beta-dihydromenaquinone-9 sulfotransferase
VIVKNPIFFIGEGRSGTTVMFEAFVKHQDIAYLSNYTEKFFSPKIGLVHRVVKKTRREDQYDKDSVLLKYLPKPIEAYDTWAKLCGDKFVNTFLKGVVASKQEKNDVSKYIDDIVKYQKKNHFATKLTGPPRIGYLSSIYAGAKFINIIRDPRAVVASLLNVGFWKQKGDKPFWEDAFTQEQYAIYKEYGQSEVALAALEWCAVYDQTELERIDKNIIDVSNESFMKNPVGEMRRIFNLVGLEPCQNSLSYIEANDYVDMNDKYKDRLSLEEINVVEQICLRQMKAHGYL